MVAQALAIVGVAAADAPWAHAAAAALLGLGGACSPTLLAAVADAAPPARRASAVGAHRAWRALGFIAGALLPVVATSAVGQPATLLTAAALTLGSGLWIAARLRGSLGRG
jgi:hypothetical protein